MKEIALIATYPELAELGQVVAAEMNIEVDIHVGLLNEAIPIAKRLMEVGYQVIISRGGTCRKLQDENLGIPIVEIRFTGYDLIRTLQEARLNGSNIALLVSKGMIYDAVTVGGVFNSSIKEYRIHSEDENFAIIQKAIADGANAIIAGASVIQCTKSIGFPSYLVKTGKEALWLAFSEAKEVNVIRRNEQERVNKLQAILDFAYEGIITVDSAGIINIFNSGAEKYLGISSYKALKKDWQDVIPEFKLSKQLCHGQIEEGVLIQKLDKQFVANKIPIKVNDITTGGVITFQEVQQLQYLEQNIRKKLNPKGHVAKYQFNNVIGMSDVIQRTINIAREFARVNSSVLLLGETGVGKEIFAQSIHNSSKRGNGPFVAINCAVLPENLLESELFGYAEGAFTGARKNGRAGLFELSHGGTIFLDELGEMSPQIQARLLRVLEEKEVMRLGDEKVIPIDVRVIAATNKDLEAMVETGSFRDDLYYRLNVLKLFIPPLRDRQADIPLLIDHFLEKCSHKLNKQIKAFSEQAINAMVNNHWPGNIRQLENFIERLLVLSNSSIIPKEEVLTAFSETKESRESKEIKSRELAHLRVVSALPTNSNLSSIEEETIKQILKETGHNYTKASQILGINRTTLWRKVKKING